MEITESVLTSVKKLLGIDEGYTHFDADIVMHINSVFSILTQMGVGPANGFSITGKDEGWSDFISGGAVLGKMREPDYKPTSDDLQTVYRMFNYVIPYDGQGDSRKGRDMYNQRTKFFHACKEAGYGAVLDTNDAIYGGFKAKSPIIVFDMEQVVPKDVYRTNLTDQKFSTLVLVGRKLLGL